MINTVPVAYRTYLVWFLFRRLLLRTLFRWTFLVTTTDFKVKQQM